MLITTQTDRQTGGEAMPSGEHRLQVLLEVKKDKLSDAQTRDRTGDKHPTRTQRSSEIGNNTAKELNYVC